MDMDIISQGPQFINHCVTEHIASVEMVRLAFPRRVFTLSQTEYVIDRVKWLYDHRHLIGGLRFVHEPKTLCFFTGKLEAVSDWPEKLIEAYIADLDCRHPFLRGHATHTGDGNAHLHFRYGIDNRGCKVFKSRVSLLLPHRNLTDLFRRTQGMRQSRT